jgi:hypothetical protein
MWQFVPAYSRVRGAGDDSIDKNMAKIIPANIPLTIHIKPSDLTTLVK